MAQGEDWRGLTGRVALAEAVHAAAVGSPLAGVQAGASARDALTRLQEAEGHFQQAIETFRRYTLPWDEAEAFEIWARTCRRFYGGRSRRSFIAEKLNSARAVYERIGAGQPWIDRLEADRKRALGTAPRPPAYPDGLSEREVEVLRLIAQGKSNQQIAGELIISLNTVLHHVTNILGKTGAANRTEAVAYAHRNGLIS